MDGFLSNLGSVLLALRDAGILLRRKKCRVGQREVDFLGFRVGTDGVRGMPDKVEAMSRLAEPVDKKGAQKRAGIVFLLLVLRPPLRRRRAPANGDAQRCRAVCVG